MGYLLNLLTEFLPFVGEQDLGTGLMYFVFSPVYFAVNALPILFALWLVWRVKALRGGESRSPPTTAPGTPLRETVEQVFRSEEYLTALRTSLPKGKDDEQFGLDYVPFMLHNLQERRRRFDRKANVYFWVTIVAGLTFAGVVGYLGYILVNDEAAGTPKSLADLEEAWDANRRLLVRADDQNFRERCSNHASILEELKLGEKNKAVAKDLSQKLRDAQSLAQASQLRTNVLEAYKLVIPDEMNAPSFRRRLDSLANELVHQIINSARVFHAATGSDFAI